MEWEIIEAHEKAALLLPPLRAIRVNKLSKLQEKAIRLIIIY